MRNWVTAGLLLAAACVGGLAGQPGCGGETDAANVEANESLTPAAALREPVTHAPAAFEPHAWSAQGCTAEGCHTGIEPIRDPASEMMQKIFTRGGEVGDPDGCTVCHGGDASAETSAAAHRGAAAELTEADGPDAFFADPASPWVNERSCGQCHMELVKAQWNSLMMTEAGKIQGTTWSFGSLEGYEHRWANYAAENPQDPHARLGTAGYRAYMEAKTRTHPDVFVDAHEPLPEAPRADELQLLETDPEQAVFTYLRAECQRCHLGVKGRQMRGDYRGMGCGACHTPYGNEGRYEGGDTSIRRDEPGHMLVHSLQATRDATVKVGEVSYTGIPVETCTTCHNRGKRIGVSYQGLMESAWGSPYTEGGGGQIGLHTKHYIAMEKDVHYQKGMLCQDCHTSGDVHGDGFLAGANLAAVEIECTDCHGTPSAYPWELPIGYGDEDGPGQRAQGPPRGVGDVLPEHLEKGTKSPARDGYLLTARGNPMPDSVRDGDLVLIRTAGGKDLWLEPLKRKVEEGTLSTEAQVAMVHAGKHIETMECYACHSSWAPQCYGCHVKADFSDGKRSFDWVAAGQAHAQLGQRTDRSEVGYDTWIPGQITEMRSYMRWEDPVLGVNGEGRVSPLIPGCQVSATVIGEDGKEIILNQIFRTSPGTEGAGEQGQLGSDMSPVQPHTTGKARSCESCHGSAKAMGYGIGGTESWDKDKVVDLTTADGTVIPAGARVQVEGIDGLADWSAVVTPEGEQLQTVGHHFPGSGPLSAEQRRNMDRRNVCIGCHTEIPDNSLAVSALHHIAQMTDQLPKSRQEHEQLTRGIALTAAWSQILTAGAAALGIGWFGFVLWRRRRR